MNRLQKIGRAIVERFTDRERWRQAASEFGYAFVAVFVPLVIAFVNGLHTGDRIVVPDFGTVRAVVVAAFGSAALAGVKAGWWVLTGTKSKPDA